MIHGNVGNAALDGSILDQEIMGTIVMYGKKMNSISEFRNIKD